METRAFGTGQNEGSGRAFGSTLARYLGQAVAPTTLTHTADRQRLAVTRVGTAGDRVCETQPVPLEDAFHIVLQRCDLPSDELWTGGRLVFATLFRHI